MAVLGVKFTMFMQVDRQLISESHYWTVAGANPQTDVYEPAVKLFKARMAMSGNGVRAVSGRLSVVGALSRTFLKIAGTDVQPIAAGPAVVVTKQPKFVLDAGGANPMDGSPDQANACVTLDAFSGLASHKRIYLGGVPDVLIREDPEGPWTVGVPSWEPLFNAYRKILLSTTTKWGFLARILPGAPPYAPVSVVSVQGQDANLLWGIELPTYAPALPQGSKLQLRHFKMNNPAYRSFNGVFQIDRVTAGPGAGNSTYWLRGSQGVAGSQVFLLGDARVVGYTLYPYLGVEIAGQTTRRRGGRPLLPLGRRRVPARVSS